MVIELLLSEKQGNLDHVMKHRERMLVSFL